MRGRGHFSRHGAGEGGNVVLAFGGNLAVLQAWLGAMMLLVAEAPSGSIASATVLARSGGAACEDVRPMLSKVSSLEDIEVDARFGVELIVEASTPFPGRARAAILSCRTRGADRPLRQYAVAFKREKKSLAPVQIIRIGDEGSHLEGIVAFLADADGDGDPELALRGTLIEARGAEHVEGEAEMYVFFSAKKSLLVKKRVRRTIAGEDGAIARSGVMQRAVAKKKSVAVLEHTSAAADDAALDRFWEDSSGEDVFLPNNERPARRIAQTGDGEMTIFEGEVPKKKLTLRGRIARVVKNDPGKAAVIYVAEQEDASEVYVVDLETLEMRKAPSGEHTLWSWSPDGEHAVLSPSAAVLSTKQWRAWIKTGLFSATETRLPKSKTASFVRWISDDAFELAIQRTHYRFDVRSKKLSKLYEVPGDE
jgi:hypothetical protein